MSAGVAVPVGWGDLSIWMVTGSSHCVLLSPLSAQRITPKLDAVRVVNDTVENCVRQGRVADQVVPTVHRKLAGDQRGAAPMAFLGDLQQVAPLLAAGGSSPQSSRISSFTPPRVRISLA